MSEEHYTCLHEKDISELKKYITGNGNPEKGLLVKVAILCDSQDRLHEGIQEIKQAVLDLSIKQNDNATENRDLAIDAKKAIDSNIAEMIGFKNGIKKVKTDEKDNLLRKYHTVAIIVGILTIASLFYQFFNHQDTKEELQKVSKEVGPHFNVRGMPYWGTDSTNLLYFENKR